MVVSKVIKKKDVFFINWKYLLVKKNQLCIKYELNKYILKIEKRKAYKQSKAFSYPNLHKI